MNLDALQIVVETLDGLALPQLSSLTLQPTTKLFGEGGFLKSLDLIRLLIGIEDEIRDAGHEHVALATEELFSATPNPLDTVGSLAEYVALKCKAQQ